MTESEISEKAIKIRREDSKIERVYSSDQISKKLGL